MQEEVKRNALLNVFKPSRFALGARQLQIAQTAGLPRMQEEVKRNALLTDVL